MKNLSVEQFGRFLIQLSGLHNVDENSYITNKDDTDSPTLIKVDGRFRQLMILKDVIKDPDAVIINPLNENITETVESKWLYATLCSALARRVLNIARHLHFIISTDKKNDESISFTSEELNFAARHKDFNDKSLEATELIAKKLMSFTSVWYNRKQKEARLRCSIHDPDTTAEFPQFSNKVWKSIAALFGELFSVNADIQLGGDEIHEKFVCSSELISVPKLESVLRLYYKIYSHINKYLELCDMDDPDFVVDLTEFGYHLEHLSDYYNKAKWFAGTVAAPERPTALQQTPINTIIPQRTVGIIRPTEESNIPPNPLRHGMHMQQQYQPMIDYSRQPVYPASHPQPFQQTYVQQFPQPQQFI